ncbi:Aldehyde dehydrogenase 22A1 [Morella rubra]|uniref:Aldehyde dehydrogenase 22A1 n=1 Tax=Morella rubra TaxID=262757 RepID=A0A6A1VM30_9ROSI|nr:Aldehyde dehydrogenase 22A1 [Morella rubra]
MAFWWPLLVLAFAYAICRFLFMLIPPNVPSIEVDASDVLDDGNQTQENSFIYIPPRGRTQQADRKVKCYEPATMKYLGFFPALTPAEVKERVLQAREAQKIWAKSSFKQRRQFLRILLNYIIKHQQLICEVSSRETGKTMVDASLGEIMTTCEKITWLLSEGERWLKPEYRSSGRSMLHKKSKVEFHPLGVIGAIVSWNYPFHNIFNPMLAAVFSGNSIVIKVSEHASWSGCFYYRIIQSALAAVGAPENLVEVITGFAETGEALVSSVDKVIFVGSPGVGKMIMRNAADTLIPVTLELGGKDPFIVCEDVDVEHVAHIAVRAALQSSGQNCAGAERFYVHKDIYSSFVNRVAKIVKSVSAGPPLAGKYDMGAICLQEHSEKLEDLVNDALEKGAEIVARGSVGNIGADAVDQFFPPTVIVNVNHTMKLMQEEAFGPIMPIMKFSTDEEAVRLANNSEYGLGCAVFSGSKSRAKEIASQIHCGVAAINDFASTYMCQSLPFGGVKHSGFGRFAGVEGLRACCLVKSVVEDRWWPFIKTVIPKPIQVPFHMGGLPARVLIQTIPVWQDMMDSISHFTSPRRPLIALQTIRLPPLKSKHGLLRKEASCTAKRAVSLASPNKGVPGGSLRQAKRK